MSKKAACHDAVPIGPMAWRSGATGEWQKHLYGGLRVSPGGMLVNIGASHDKTHGKPDVDER
eukprot:4141745-Prorocentrum_lima.AAC.1